MTTPAHPCPEPPTTPQAADSPVTPPLLYTPAQAAEKLAITESWLRRKAGQRLIPCTFLGKHLRFSDDDLRAIVTAGGCLTRSSPQRARRSSRRRHPR